MADKIVHTIHLDRYAPMPAQIQLGTVESYGVEQIAVVAGAGWDGLDIVAVYHPPKAAEPVRVLVPSDGLSDVPPEATASAGRGALVIAGMADGVQIASCNIAYTVIAQAGTDGTTSDAPTPDLVQQILSAANGAVKTADGVRADMDKVLEAESGRKTAEADRAEAESERVEAEAARAAAEADRAAAEKERQTDENARIAAEDDRQSAETSRAKAETARESAETDRVAAEAARVKAEQERADYERLRKDHESQRVTDETARQTAESKRQEAETARADAESKRAAAEQARAEAESTRVAAEAARQEAETKRASAEQERQTAEQGRVEAESSRVKAEAEREKQLPALKSSVDELQVRQNILVGSETGNPVTVDDAFAAPLCGLHIYGKSTQDGTPTPDAPVPIVSAGDGGSVAMKVTGRNLVYTHEYQSFFINMNGSQVGLSKGNTSIVLQVPTGAEYYITRKAVGTKFRVATVDKLPTTSSVVTTSNAMVRDSVQQIKISATAKYMIIQCEDEAAFDELMVSLDSSTAYSPYREQLLTLPTPNGLPGIPVTSGGNYTDSTGQQWVCDEVDLERGVKVQRLGKAEIVRVGVSEDSKWFDETKSYSYEITQFTYPVVNAPSYVRYEPCNRFEMFNFGGIYNKGIENGGLMGYSYAVFNVSKSLGICTTANEFKEWFNENVVLYKILATPIETPLTADEIAAYKALTAYAPDTVVQASDGAGIRLDCQRDVNLVVKKLEDAIASMTTT